MPRETVAQREARYKKELVEVKTTTESVIVFKDTEGGEYEARYRADKDDITVTAPCGDEQTFKLQVLKSLLDVLPF